MAQEIKVVCRGENCPVLLVETRKAIRKAKKDDVISVTGDHPASIKEIPMAVEAIKKEIPMTIKPMGMKLLSVEGKEDNWEIKIKI